MKNDIISKLNIFALCTFMAFGSLISSCKKEEVEFTECFADALTVRQIQNQPAKIILVGSKFYIVEESTIDTRLGPCNLEQEFQVANLLVTISGDVKATLQEGICCTNNFVITKISEK